MLPNFPFLFRKFLAGIAIEQLPERRTEDPFATHTERQEIVLVYNLMGIIINTNLATDPPENNTERNQGLFYNIVILSETPESDIHIIEALRENLNAALIMPVILVPVNSIRRKCFEITIVILNTGFVNDYFTINDHDFADIRLRIQRISAGNGNIGINLPFALEKLGAKEPGRKTVGMMLCPGNDPGLFICLFCEVCGEGSFTRAGDAKIDIQDIRDLFRAKPTIEDIYCNNDQIDHV